MACTKCQNSSTSNCGCKDTAYTTVKTYTCPADDVCPTPAPCSEYVSTACTYYSNSGILDIGLEPGRSLQSIIQQLIIRTGDTPNCADPCSTCQSTWNLYVTDVTGTTITIAWDASNTAESYQIEYQPLVDGCNLSTWTLVTPQTTLINTIGNLTPNTLYAFRVNAICDTGNCYSVIITQRTNLS